MTSLKARPWSCHHGTLAHAWHTVGGHLVSLLSERLQEDTPGERVGRDREGEQVSRGAHAMALPPERPHHHHGSSFWSCTASLLGQGWAGYARWLDSYHIPLLETGHMGSFQVSSGVSGEE